MLPSLVFALQTFLVFHASLSLSVRAVSTDGDTVTPTKRKGYSKGDTVPVTCLNRTIETGEHITDSLGNLQYIPFITCNETNNSPLSFTYGVAETRTCTIETLPDELYHLIQYFVHSDVPLSCRVPSYPSAPEDSFSTSIADSTSAGVGAGAAADSERWTPLTIALQGTLQYSHLHLHTDINVLFHTDSDDESSSKKNSPHHSYTSGTSHLIASTAYSLPNLTNSVTKAGTRIIATEPLRFTFNVGWIPGTVLPGMVSQDTGKLYMGVTDHRFGFSLLSLFSLLGAAGTGALVMLLYERRKSGRAGMNGLLGGNSGPSSGYAVSSGANRTGYGGYDGYGGYGGYSGPGKKD